MRRFQRGQVTLHSSAESEQTFKIESACGCCALRQVSTFLNGRFKSAKNVTWQNATWQDLAQQTAESKLASLTKSF
jgi:hypothetical protein